MAVTEHYFRRVPPFGYPRIYACLRLPVAFRSLPRPSSAISALASSLRSFSLDLPAGSRAPSALAASSLLPLRYVHLPKTIEKCPYLFFSVSVPRFRLDSFRASLQPLSVSSFPVQFSRCDFAFRLPFRFAFRFPFRSRFQLLSRSLFSAIPQNDTVKSFRQTPARFRFAGFILVLQSFDSPFLDRFPNHGSPNLLPVFPALPVRFRSPAFAFSLPLPAST